MGIQSYASRHGFRWVAAALFTAAPAVAQARDWWVIEPGETCQNPHVYSSPADQIKTLTREGNSVQVKKTEFPDGSFALSLSFSGGKTFWVTSQQTCNFIVAAVRPSQVDTDWNDFQ
jgi:hypothetical protein